MSSGNDPNLLPLGNGFANARTLIPPAATLPWALRRQRLPARNRCQANPHPEKDMRFCPFSVLRRQDVTQDAQKATIFRDTSARSVRDDPITRTRKVVVSALEWEDRILLCRRAIQARRASLPGYVPDGFMENRGNHRGSQPRGRPARKKRALPEIGALYGLVISSQVRLFCARLLDLDFGPGPESLEVRLFPKPRIP